MAARKRDSPSDLSRTLRLEIWKMAQVSPNAEMRSTSAVRTGVLSLDARLGGSIAGGNALVRESSRSADTSADGDGQTWTRRSARVIESIDHNSPPSQFRPSHMAWRIGGAASSND